MKIFFDTNVYVAEALLGEAAGRMLDATVQAGWRIYASAYLLDECRRVMVDKLGFGRCLALLTQRRIRRRARLVESGSSRHAVPADPNDNPILQAALTSGADYLVTNDADLLSLNPYQGMRILSMEEYYRLLLDENLLS